MYTYKFSDEETEEISKKTAEYDNIKSLFDGVDKKYDFSQEVNQEDYETQLNLERKQSGAKTDEEIQAQAQNELYDYQTSSKSAIENSYTKGVEGVEENLAKLENTTSTSKQNLAEAVESAKEKASNDALKRGLARSSIIVNKLASYDQTYLTEFANLEKTYIENQTKLNSEKSLLEVQKQNALDAFDIAYAVKLSDKINTINEKLLKQEQEVLEYNNKLEQTEKEFDVKMQESLKKAEAESTKANMDYADFIAKNGEHAIEAIKEKEKYSIAQEYFATLPKHQALFELENNSYFKTQLKSYYNVLLKEIEQKQE